MLWQGNMRRGFEPLEIYAALMRTEDVRCHKAGNFCKVNGGGLRQKGFLRSWLQF